MANMANRNNGEPQSGEFQAPKFWKGLPRILMGLSVFLFALTLVINAPTVVTLKPDDVIFADRGLSTAKERLSSEKSFNIISANWFSYKVKDKETGAVGWVPKIKTVEDAVLSFALLLSCVLFVLGLNLWAVSLRTQRYVGGQPTPIVIKGGYSADVKLKVRYSFSVSLGGSFLHDVGRLARAAMVERNVLSIMESLGAVIAKRAAEFTSAQARQEIPKIVEGFNTALRVFNRGGINDDNEEFLKESLSPDVLDQLQTLYAPIDQVISVVDLAPETVEAERDAGRVRVSDVVDMPLLDFGVKGGYITKEEAEAIRRMPPGQRRRLFDWLGGEKQAFVNQKVALLSAESGGREAEAKAIMARSASEGLQLAKTGGENVITSAIEFVKALLAG